MNPTAEYSYDLFVSYSRSDRGWVEGYLLDALAAANVRVVSELNFTLGAPRLAEFERALKQSKRTLLVLSPAYLAESALQFVDLMMQSYGMESGAWPVIPLILEEVELPPRLAFLGTLDATEVESWPQVVARLCQTVQTGPPAPATRPPCPYPGMRAFRLDEAAHFYGREAEVDELVQRLRLHPFAAVIGPSGSGKSSLVLAGLLPALQRSALFGAGSWLTRIVRPGDHPLAALSAALGVAEMSQFTPGPLLTAENATRLLVVIDQFEEVFTQDGGQRDEFFSAIQRLISLRDCYVVITVRSDFFTDLLNSSLWPTIDAHRLDIAPLGVNGIRAAIVKPAEDMGVFIESALVERLTLGSAGQPGLLPFLQEVMARLWEKLERRYLPLRAYEALILPLAGYSGSERESIIAALALLADEVLHRLTPVEQAMARRIFLRLVQFGEGRLDTRRQQPVSALAAVGDAPGQLDRVLNYLADNRLVVLSGDQTGERRVDLAHEAMLTGWPKLANWVKEGKEAEKTRRRLEERAAEWVRLGRKGGLFDRAELYEAVEWQTANHDFDCSEALVEFIANSKRNDRRQRLKQTLARVVLAIIVLLAVGIAGNTLSNWLINRQWESATGAPNTRRVSALAGNGYEIVIGNYDYGVAWTNNDGQWTGWESMGLPQGNPADGLNDPASTTKQIDSIALDPARTNDRYIFVQNEGVFKYDENERKWFNITERIPQTSDACLEDGICQPVAVYDGLIAYIADEPGILLSQDSGETWLPVRPTPSSSSGQMFTVIFDKEGRILLGDDHGLIRGSDPPQFQWERIFDGGQVLQVTPDAHGVLLLVVKEKDKPGVMCLDANDERMGEIQELPISNPFLSWTGFLPLEAVAVAADPQKTARFYLATSYGAIYAFDCLHAPQRIGQGRFPFELVSRLATVMETDQERVLYWGTYQRLDRLVNP